MSRLAFFLPFLALPLVAAEPTEDDYYPIRGFAIPEGEVIEPGGFQLMPDGKMAVCSRRGEIWMIEDPLAADVSKAKFSLYAQGLHEPLGMAYRDGWLYVIQRGELTRVRDSDGDVPINTGVVPLWVHVDNEAPVVRLFSYVVRSVKDLRQARIEVGILNRRTPYLKFTLEEGTIVASYELAAGPFVGPLLLNTIDRVSELLNEIAADSATRVSGKLWFADREDAGSTPERGEAS